MTDTAAASSSTPATPSSREALRLAKRRLEQTRSTLATSFYPQGRGGPVKGQEVPSIFPTGFSMLRNKDDVRAFLDVLRHPEWRDTSKESNSTDWRTAVDDYSEARREVKAARKDWQEDLSGALTPERDAKAAAKAHLASAREALQGGTGTAADVATARGEFKTARHAFRQKRREYSNSGIPAPSTPTTSPTS